MSPAARRGFSFVLPGSRPMIAAALRSAAVLPSPTACCLARRSLAGAPPFAAGPDDLSRGLMWPPALFSPSAPPVALPCEPCSGCIEGGFRGDATPSAWG
jgi:hypothetical protein